MTAILDDAELRHYREQGYVIPRYRLPRDLLERLRAGVDQVLATYTDVAQEDLANPHMIPPTDGPRVNPFMEAARHPQTLDMVEQVLGPDLVLWITRILCKPAGKGREAVSEYKTLKTFKHHALLEFHPHTGRTHQIRLHCAFLGCPIVGDTVYGRKTSTLPLSRHFLHAAKLKIVLPGEKQASLFETPLPEELKTALAEARML